MKRVFFAALLMAVSALADDAAKVATPTAGLVSAEHQASYWKAWGAFQSFNLQYERSLTTEQRALLERIKDYGDKLQKEISTVEGDCKAVGKIFDNSKFQTQGTLDCSPAPPASQVEPKEQ